MAAAKASDDAKVAIEKAAAVGETVKTEIEKVRTEFNGELDRIKKLPQPSKGAISEATVAEKDFVANPGETVTKAATPTAASTLGESIMKRALAGDPMAQRMLREAVEAGTAAGQLDPKAQDTAAKAAIAEAWKHPARIG